MRRAVVPLLGLSGFLALLLVCYWPVLFNDAQFASANASYFYPLDLRVQQEWEAGRWPLWDLGHNGGEPLLGNPMCAVSIRQDLHPAPLRLGGPGVRDRACTPRLLGHDRPGAVVWSDLGRVVPRWSELCIRWAGVVPLFQPNSPGRLGLGSVGSLCDRPPDAPRTASGHGRASPRSWRFQVLGGDPEDAYLTAVCGAGYAVMSAIRRDSSGVVPRQVDHARSGAGYLGRCHARPGVHSDRSAGVPYDGCARARVLVRLGTRAGLALDPPSK